MESLKNKGKLIMPYNKMIVNDGEYSFNKVTLDYIKKEIHIEGDDQKFELLLVEWLNETVDHGKGINPNYKKDIQIEYNGNIVDLEGCWVSKFWSSDTATHAIISYDFLV